LHSIAGKLVLLVIVFAAVPVVLYSRFQTADEEKRGLLVQAIREQGRLVSEALVPLLRDFSGQNVAALNDALVRIGAGNLRIKLLLRPTETSDIENYYFVAAHPRVPSEYLDLERIDLIATGVLKDVSASCAIGVPSIAQYRNPAGKDEALTSISPVLTDRGCWVVILSQTEDALLGSVGRESYWETPEIRLAAAIYASMALIVLALFFGAWENLRRFAALARRVRVGTPTKSQSFLSLNRVPELRGIAAEFDRMVEVLRGTADAIRLAAHENAHAIKTPIAIISQSIEPIKRALPPSDESARKACIRIERSVDRLDALVGAARRIEETIAESISSPLQRVDLSALLSGMLDTYKATVAPKGLRIDQNIERGLFVLSGDETLETVMENLLANALSFSPQNGRIIVSASRAAGDAVLLVEDEGPGVDPAEIKRIFQRYSSNRPERGQPVRGEAHYGIGLWIVRRNVESLGGRVHAENRVQGGLRIQISLPRAA
jgi:two-component system sensor histidine kinase ChvG